MKRVFWILITPLAGVLILWVLGAKVVGPRLEAWALGQIQDYSDSSLPVKIRAQSLHLHFFKPSVSLEGIEILPQGEMAEALQPVRVGSVRIFMDFFNLLGGRLNLSAVVVDSPEVEIQIDPFLESDKPPEALPIDEIFAQTEKIPLQRLFLRNIQVKVSSKKMRFESNLTSGDLLVTNMGKNLTLRASVPSLQLDLDKVGHFEGSLDSHLYLTRQSLRILQLGARLDQSEVSLRGEINPISQVTLKPQGTLDISSKIQLGDLYQEIHRLRPDLKIPSFAGQLQMESELRFAGLESIRGKADIKTESVVVDKFELGNARIQGEYKDREISLSEIKVQHPAGEATITRSQISLAGDNHFKAQVSVPRLDLQKLFQSLNLEIPVGVSLKGTLPCEGQVRPDFQLTCQDVELSGKNLWVRSSLDKKATSILDLDELAAKGKVTVTTQAVTYNADLFVGENSGTTDGVVDFDKGFKINYATKKLDFKDVKNLANLKLQGTAGLEGSTSGDSETAIFDMKINARNFIFEDFSLGNLISDLKFRKSVLKFQDIAGALGKTQYVGDLDVDLNRNRLRGDFSVPTAELANIAQVFQQIYQLPFDIQGQGGARAHVEGPLDFWKMNYHLESNFKNVFIGPESFDSLAFNVSAIAGSVQTDSVVLTKGNSTLNVRGGINSEQIMNLYADGKNWRLEQSDIISKINSGIVGNVNLSAELKDSVKNPQITVKGSVTDTLFEEQEIPNSNFVLEINRDLFGAQASLFGNRVQGEVQLPFEHNKKPLIVKINTNEWNYSSLLGLVGGANLAGEYHSVLTSSIDFRSESGNIFKSTGHIHIQKMELARGSLSLHNKSPIEINLTNGVASIKNFHLTGPGTDVLLKGENFTSDHLNANFNMNADLRLFQIFTPFLDDLGGGVTMATQFSGSLQKPQILGNLNTNNVFLKLKGFPHPIERLSLDVVFSQSRILISSLRGTIAGGTLSGDGGILINGIKDLPTSIRLRMEGVTFNVPDKVRSSGNADLLLSGRWFPFTLSGTYHVSSALVEKEFTEDGGGSGVRQSIYLPKFIRESQFEPILLDLQLILEKNILVRNSLLDGSVTGNLQVKGPPGNPILLGRISTEKKTKLIFKDKIFEIQNGVIDFNDPNEINPNLYITAQSRIADYDVTVLAQGPSKNMTIRLSSVPPLPDKDIISLIALGVTSSSMDQNLQSRQQAEQLGAEIGGAVLAKPINQGLLGETGFNLSVTSQYDSTRNISVPKITLSRQLAENLKASASRPARESQSYDFKLEYLINSNFTAVGSFENRGVEENTTLQTSTPAQSIFGLDIEFKREFK